MSAHTPGPWEISGGALRIFSSKTSEPIAFVLGCTPEDGLSPTPEKAVANARLIAASPALLAALEMAVRQNGHDMLMTGEELRKCSAAIASARGAA